MDTSNHNYQQNGDGGATSWTPAVRAVAQTADQLRRADQELIAWVKERPLASVAIALGVGYFVGRLLSRWG